MGKEEGKLEQVIHLLPPIFDSTSKILILGTMPSPRSREAGFYYAHPQNRFWRVLSELLREPLPGNNKERKELLIRHHIALWDVLASCEISGAQDASIKKPVANDIGLILLRAPIRAVFTTGTKAAALYKKYCLPGTGVQPICLPSTSPANCRRGYESIREEYSVLLQYL